MIILGIGVLIWCATHLMPAVAPSLRVRLRSHVGEHRYRGMFALLILISLVLIVLGWRSAEFRAVYHPPSWGRAAAIPLVFLTFVLFAASPVKSNIKRFVRHPQLTGVVLWAVAHLLCNGEGRSLLLFGSMGAWALLEIVLIGRRDGAWERPAFGPAAVELKPLLVGTLTFAVVFALHPLLFGASPGLGR